MKTTIMMAMVMMLTMVVMRSDDGVGDEGQVVC
jgi:hypothetical protein